MKTKTAPQISPVMQEVSAYIAAAPKKTLPKEVAEKTKHHVLDTIAAMVSGSRLLPGKKAISYIKTLGGAKEATVIGSRFVTTAINAALANGMLGHADETDDSHAPSLCHPGCAIVPAALAMAERERRNGTALLRAVALGYDIGCRINLSLNAYEFREDGHSTHSFGPMFGAAAATGSLCGFDARQARHLLSYTAQQASGVSCWMRDEEHIEKAFDFGGMPARNGTAAAAMVAHGFSAVEDVFAGERNFFVAYGRAPKPEVLVRGLGSTLRNHEHQHQALVGRLADPGAARRPARFDPRAPDQGGQRRKTRGARLAPGCKHREQPPHAGHLHAAHVRGHAARQFRHVQVVARRKAHARQESARAAEAASNSTATTN